MTASGHIAIPTTIPLTVNRHSHTPYILVAWLEPKISVWRISYLPSQIDPKLTKINENLSIHINEPSSHLPTPPQQPKPKNSNVAIAFFIQPLSVS